MEGGEEDKAHSNGVRQNDEKLNFVEKELRAFYSMMIAERCNFYVTFIQRMTRCCQCSFCLKKKGNMVF